MLSNISLNELVISSSKYGLLYYYNSKTIFIHDYKTIERAFLSVESANMKEDLARDVKDYIEQINPLVIIKTTKNIVALLLSRDEKFLIYHTSNEVFCYDIFSVTPSSSTVMDITAGAQEILSCSLNNNYLSVFKRGEVSLYQFNVDSVSNSANFRFLRHIEVELEYSAAHLNSDNSLFIGNRSSIKILRLEQQVPVTNITLPKTDAEDFDYNSAELSDIYELTSFKYLFTFRADSTAEEPSLPFIVYTEFDKDFKIVSSCYINNPLDFNEELDKPWKHRYFISKLEYHHNELLAFISSNWSERSCLIKFSNGVKGIKFFNKSSEISVNSTIVSQASIYNDICDKQWNFVYDLDGNRKFDNRSYIVAQTVFYCSKATIPPLLVLGTSKEVEDLEDFSAVPVIVSLTSEGVCQVDIISDSTFDKPGKKPFCMISSIEDFELKQENHITVDLKASEESSVKEEFVQPKEFIPAEEFNGTKSGFVFKKSDKGLGYHRDLLQESPIIFKSVPILSSDTETKTMQKVNNLTGTEMSQLLTKVYSKYNPSKLETEYFIDNVVEKYAHSFYGLLLKLAKKYDFDVNNFLQEYHQENTLKVEKSSSENSFIDQHRLTLTEEPVKKKVGDSFGGLFSKLTFSGQAFKAKEELSTTPLTSTVKTELDQAPLHQTKGFFDLSPKVKKENEEVFEAEIPIPDDTNAGVSESGEEVSETDEEVYESSTDSADEEKSPIEEKANSFLAQFDVKKFQAEAEAGLKKISELTKDEKDKKITQLEEKIAVLERKVKELSVKSKFVSIGNIEEIRASSLFQSLPSESIDFNDYKTDEAELKNKDAWSVFVAEVQKYDELDHAILSANQAQYDYYTKQTEDLKTYFNKLLASMQLNVNVYREEIVKLKKLDEDMQTSVYRFKIRSDKLREEAEYKKEEKHYYHELQKVVKEKHERVKIKINRFRSRLIAFKHSKVDESVTEENAIDVVNQQHLRAIKILQRFRKVQALKEELLKEERIKEERKREESKQADSVTIGMYTFTKEEVEKMKKEIEKEKQVAEVAAKFKGTNRVISVKVIDVTNQDQPPKKDSSEINAMSIKILEESLQKQREFDNKLAQEAKVNREQQIRQLKELQLPTFEDILKEVNAVNKEWKDKNMLTNSLVKDIEKHVASPPKLEVKQAEGTSEVVAAQPPTTVVAPQTPELVKTQSFTSMKSEGLNYRDELINFYTKYNATKLNTVDETLKKYAGKEKELFQKLYKKYDVPPESQKEDFKSQQPPQSRTNSMFTPKPNTQSTFFTPNSSNNSTFQGFGNSSFGQTQAVQGEDYRTKLTAFYQKHNPSKLSSVDSTLMKYKGRETQLFAMLNRKYKVNTGMETSGFSFANQPSTTFGQAAPQQGSPFASMGGNGNQTTTFGNTSNNSGFGGFGTPSNSSTGFGSPNSNNTSAFGNFSGGTTFGGNSFGSSSFQQMRK